MRLSDGRLVGGKRSGDAKVIRVVYEYTFKCGECGKKAETVKLFQHPTPCEPYPITTHEGGGALLFHLESEAVQIEPENFPMLKEVIQKGDAAALYKIQPFWISTYCPKCQCCYCMKHWETHDVVPSWGDAYSMDFVTEGTCPKGHKREMAV